MGLLSSTGCSCIVIDRGLGRECSGETRTAGFGATKRCSPVEENRKEMRILIEVVSMGHSGEGRGSCCGIKHTRDDIGIRKEVQELKVKFR